MKITNVTTYVVKVKKQSYLGGQAADAVHDARGDYVRSTFYRSKYSLNTETVFTKIDTDAGVTGWGEAQAPLVPEATAQAIHRLVAPFLIGASPFDVDFLWNDAYDGMRERGHTGGFMLDAIAACDIALWDILGKALEQPVHKLLGGCYRNRVRSYVSGLPAATARERAEKAKSWQDKGYSAFKLALGYGRGADLETVAAVREAVGPNDDIMVDAHWRYTVPEAIEIGQELEKLGLSFFEAPIVPEDLPGQVEVTRALTVPVAVGEELRSRFEYRDRLVHRAFDLAQPDVGRMGISEFRKVANLVETFGLPVAPHLGVGLGIYMAASVQVAAAIPNFLIIEYQPDQFVVANQLLHEPIRNEAGYYHVPETPGLGVMVNEEAVKEHATDVLTVN